MTAPCAGTEQATQRKQIKSAITVACPMGLEQSGLAITVARYVAALHAAGVPSDAAIVSAQRHPEHAEVRQYVDLAGFVDDLLATASRRRHIVLWIGLQSAPAEHRDQLAAIRQLSAAGCANIVVPERTGMPEWDAYNDFIGCVEAGAVHGLVHFNLRELEKWSGCRDIPQLVAQPPIPDPLFEVGHARLRKAREQSEPAILFIGRLSRRKGLDRLLASWPSLSRQLGDAALYPTMHVFGRAFMPAVSATDADEHLDAPLMWPDGFRWAPTFPNARELASLPIRAVGLALSTQEFDGIAVSEMLALGLPVVATPTSGHLALAEESRGVTIARDDDEVFQALRGLLSDQHMTSSIRRRGYLDIRRTRSYSSVGGRLAAFLQSFNVTTGLHGAEGWQPDASGGGRRGAII